MSPSSTHVITATTLAAALCLAASPAAATPVAFGGYRLGMTAPIAEDAKVTVYGCEWDVTAERSGDVVTTLHLTAFSCGDDAPSDAATAQVTTGLTKQLGAVVAATASNRYFGWNSTDASVLLFDGSGEDVGPRLELLVRGPEDPRRWVCFADDGFGAFIAGFDARLRSGAKPDARALAGSFQFPFTDTTGHRAAFRNSAAFVAKGAKQLLRPLRRIANLTSAVDCDTLSGTYQLHLEGRGFRFDHVLKARRAPDGAWQFTGLEDTDR